MNHPQSNGSLERFYLTFVEMIRVHKIENPGENTFLILPLSYTTIFKIRHMDTI